MKRFKSYLSLFLVLALLLGFAPQAFAAYNGTYGLWVPATNSSVVWVNNNGTSNQNQIRSMSAYREYQSANGIYGYYNNIIFVNPGNVSLAMSEAKKIATDSFDTTISSPSSWTFMTLSGSCKATTSSYQYNTSGMYPGTWYKVNIPAMKLGDLVQVNAYHMTGYIYCGSPSDAYMTLTNVDGIDVNGKTYEINPDWGNVKLNTGIGLGSTPYDAVEIQKITWKSSDSTVAAVSNGNVSFTGKTGKVTITSSYTFYMTTGLALTTLSRSVTFDVKTNEVASIEISPATATIQAREEIQLTATISPSNATNQNVTWSSSDSSVATVDQTGKVIGVSAGTVTIKAVSSNGISVQSVIKVTPKEKLIYKFTIGAYESMIDQGNKTITFTVPESALSGSKLAGEITELQADSDAITILVGTSTYLNFQKGGFVGFGDGDTVHASEGVVYTLVLDIQPMAADNQIRELKIGTYTAVIDQTDRSITFNDVPATALNNGRLVGTVGTLEADSDTILFLINDIEYPIKLNNLAGFSNGDKVYVSSDRQYTLVINNLAAAENEIRELTIGSYTAVINQTDRTVIFNNVPAGVLDNGRLVGIISGLEADGNTITFFIFGYGEYAGYRNGLEAGFSTGDKVYVSGNHQYTLIINTI